MASRAPLAQAAGPRRPVPAGLGVVGEPVEARERKVEHAVGALLDAAAGVAKAAPVGDAPRHAAEELALSLHAARAAAAADSLLQLVDDLKRDALLGDHAAVVERVETAEAAARQRAALAREALAEVGAGVAATLARAEALLAAGAPLPPRR